MLSSFRFLLIVLFLFSCGDSDDDVGGGGEPGPKAGAVITLTDQIDGGSGGVEVDAAGNIYLGDFGVALGTTPGDKVFKVTPDGDVSIFVSGLPGATGNTFDANGNLLQSNNGASRVSSIAPDGTVSIYATGVPGPIGIIVDDVGDAYVCNCTNGSGSITKISNGVVSTLVTSSLLNCPNGIAFASDGNLYVANFNDGRIIRVSRSGSASHFTSINGNNNGHLVYRDGFLYVVARTANQIWKVSLSAKRYLFAGDGQRAITDGDGKEASFSLPNDLAFSPDGRYLYVNDVVNLSGTVIVSPMVVRRIEIID